MKKVFLTVGLLALALISSTVEAQVTGMPLVDPSMGLPTAKQLTRFDLDFPGGTPGQLTEAIEKATGRPLNVIIPKENTDLQLPSFKMNDVTVAQLFEAVQRASMQQEAYKTGRSNEYSIFQSTYTFSTTDKSPTDNSIWYFRADKPTLPPTAPIEKISQYFSLEPYLNRGFTVDDITTAIQTGWKMARVSPAPDLNYHKETKLLIAYGEPAKLNVIQQVLGTLPQAKDSQDLAHKIESLQLQINGLKQQLLTRPGAAPALPEEKSGK